MRFNPKASAIAMSAIAASLACATAAHADTPIGEGIVVFGAVDVGIGYAAHGMPINGDLYLPMTVVQKNADKSTFGLAPNGLAQTSIGIKAEEQIVPGLSGVFMAATGFNPQSGKLANGPGSLQANNGVAALSQSLNADASRGGQAINHQLYVGLSSKVWGTLTFGRQKSLSTDLIGTYDPAGGSYDYSVIGFSGTPVAGMGFTDDGRVDNAVKYRFAQGAFHAAALYKFKDGSAGVDATGAALALHNDGYQFDIGAKLGGLEVDALYSRFNQAVTYGALGVGATTVNGVVEQNLGNPGLKGTAADTSGYLLTARYTVKNVKLYAGWSHVRYKNPANPIGVGANIGQGGYTVIVAANAAYTDSKTLDTEWVGAKVTLNKKTGLTVAYYHEGQNNYAFSAADVANCAIASNKAATCSGGLSAVSAYVDRRLSKHFDIYGGAIYSSVSGGLSAGYLHTDNFAPTVGARFAF